MVSLESLAKAVGSTLHSHIHSHPWIPSGILNLLLLLFAVVHRYLSRDAWLERGVGQPRLNHTGVYEGAFDAASNAVVRGISQVLCRRLSSSHASYA